MSLNLFPKLLFLLGIFRIVHKKSPGGGAIEGSTRLFDFLFQRIELGSAEKLT